MISLNYRKKINQKGTYLCQIWNESIRRKISGSVFAWGLLNISLGSFNDSGLKMFQLLVFLFYDFLKTILTKFAPVNVPVEVYQVSWHKRLCMMIYCSKTWTKMLPWRVFKSQFLHTSHKPLTPFYMEFEYAPIGLKKPEAMRPLFQFREDCMIGFEVMTDIFSANQVPTTFEVIFLHNVPLGPSNEPSKYTNRVLKKHVPFTRLKYI